MKTPNVSIRIPEPCHESWELMQPGKDGKFCGSCQKTVIDFTGKSDVEIRDILLSQVGQKVCGHFKKTQVNRPLQLNVDLNVLPVKILPVKKFAIALLLVFGTTLVSCFDHSGVKIDQIEISANGVDSYPYSLTGEVIPFETKDSVNTKETSTEIPDTCSEGMKGDVLMIEEIMGKVAYTPDPQDTLADHGAKVVTPPDSSQISDIPFTGETLAGAIAMVYEEEPETNDSIISKEEIITALEHPTGVYEKNISVYPNPSHGEFTVHYALQKPSDVNVYIFNADGRLIKTLAEVKAQHSGNYQIPADLQQEAAGVYLAVLICNGKKSTQRLILSK